MLSTDTHQAQLSPDGRWLAYTSTESGNWEIYVTDFPEAVAKWPVSAASGVQPRWSKNDSKLFYLGADGYLTSVAFTVTGDQPIFDAPEKHFPLGAGSYVGAGVRAQYDVSPEGDRFVVSVETGEEVRRARVVLNWFDELSRAVPVP